ncbi:hypothetical protein PVK06_025582 [Gossypium arboreum]|uniref:CCHC-type domain-containing protein n=1 Tax=Gossypium arboreum TaxID=29729 RepID=A0ABR0PH86_GOSAR|nr:hypothetical protein PVK06_025582 [Gossypium arboreum]
MIQIDSLEVVMAIQESSTGGTNTALIRRILKLLFQISHWNIYYIPRAENQKIYRLAKMAHSGSQDTVNGYFFVKFQDIGDYNKVLTQGPWIIYGQYLIVQPWTKDFNPLQPYPSVVMVDGTVQQVEYEALPIVCFSCGKYGHVKELCPTVMVDQTRGQSVNVVVEAQGCISGRPDSDKRPEFRPWMLVERKMRGGQRVRDLESGLMVANGDFSQEKVREREVVDDGGLNVRVNIGVNKNSGPNFEAGHGNASGHGALLEPAKGISLDSLGVIDLGQKSNFSLDKFLGKRLMELASKGVEIQIFEGVLDSGKHSVVSFKENFTFDQQVFSNLIEQRRLVTLEVSGLVGKILSGSRWFIVILSLF